MTWEALLPQILERAKSRPYATRTRQALFRGSMGTPDRAAAVPFLQAHRDVINFEANGTGVISCRNFSQWYECRSRWGFRTAA